ncbi:MAG TPA: SigE family RNA polymerase sigma factor [Nocardioides sp.]|jgi:RNA polymerase sigma-70 factor (sigma-E family)|nr:SigE family RNA polymerase sigma factor [Nocardioides sp.]
MRTDAREQAYVEFVTARQTHLRRIAYAICGDWDRADDLLQAALVKLYVAWPRVQRLGSEDAFVRRIIVRANVDEHRGSGRHQIPGAEGHGGATLFEALQALPAVQRKTVVLRHWLGLSVEETAEELGISPGSVRSHASRALASLHVAQSREAR